MLMEPPASPFPAVILMPPARGATPDEIDTPPELVVESAVEIDTAPDEDKEDEPVAMETEPVVSGLEAVLTRTDPLEVVPLAPPARCSEPPAE
jgi:hypothetical protein